MSIKIKRLIVIICIIVFVAGCCVAGFFLTRSKKDKGLNIQEIPTQGEFQGMHEIKAEKLSAKIFADKKTEYKIVIPDDASSKISAAANELKLLLNTASGGNIFIVLESEVSNADKFISLGKTSMFQSAKIELSREELGENGYRIITKESNVYICGGGDSGTLNGVYTFLELVVKFRVYAADEVQLDYGDVYLYQLDVKDVPDIQYRVGDVTTRIDGDENYRMRLKYNSNSDVFMFAKGSLYHNDFVYFPPDEYSGEEYKDWYSESNGTTDYLQLCYSAHGNNEKQAKMLDIAAKIIVDTALEQNAETVTFMQQDINVWCSCKTCAESKAKYGTDSAVVIKFLNKLSDTVAEKLKAIDQGDRKINICFFAYQCTEKAPANKDSDGNYQPIDDSVILRDNVYVYYAPIYMQYNKSFYASENTAEADTLKAWNAVSKKTLVWLYQTNFTHYLYPYNSLPTMQERYRFLAEQGAMFIFDQNQWDQMVKTSFHRLKGWMGAKLAWNVNANYEALLDEYFDGYFYEASNSMRRLYDEITFHMEFLSQEMSMDGNIYYNINQSKFFSKGLLDGWMNLLDNAMRNIDKYRETDPELYKKLADRIGIEGMSIRYMILDMHSSKFSQLKLKELQSAFMNDCFQYGIDMVAEIKNISEVFIAWGLM